MAQSDAQLLCAASSSRPNPPSPTPRCAQLRKALGLGPPVQDRHVIVITDLKNDRFEVVQEGEGGGGGDGADSSSSPPLTASLADVVAAALERFGNMPPSSSSLH